MAMALAASSRIVDRMVAALIEVGGASQAGAVAEQSVLRHLNVKANVLTSEKTAAMCQCEMEKKQSLRT